MAIVQNPIIGAARKQVGNMVFTRTGGRNIMRTKPFSVKNPRTKDQVDNRDRFDVINKAYQMSLIPSLIQFYNRYPKKTFRSFAQEVKNKTKSLLVSDDGAYTILPAKMTLGGNKLNSIYPETIVFSAGNVTVTWDQDQPMLNPALTDKVRAFLFCPVDKVMICLNPTGVQTIDDEAITVAVPAFLTDGADCTIFLLREIGTGLGGIDTTIPLPDMVGTAALIEPIAFV